MVSTANLPQLAVDLLISSLGLERVEVLDKLAKYLIPVAGGREGGEVGITTPLELFSKPGGNYPYCILQQRSPVMQVIVQYTLINSKCCPDVIIGSSEGSETRVH
jgi:proteasome assembly chaperone 2